ncbi:MAG TPA: preprotein translocase subunit YajC [Bacteroidetes bacterium]|nr:preprotein translocase subunit YajC [Bacteroidota bacterium]
MQNFIFLQSDAIKQMLPLLLIFIVFWFFILRPQMKKQKQQTKFADSLARGQEVVTSSGIIGKIVRIDGEIVHLEIANKTVIRITKGAISRELTEAVAKNKTDNSPIEMKS